MKTILRTGTAAVFAALASTPAAAQVGSQLRADCALRIESPTTNWHIQGYDPFASSAPIATFDATFVNDGGAACVFDPIFVVDQDVFGLSRSTDSKRVAYTLLDQFSGVSVTPTSGRTIAGATRRPVVVQPRSQQLVRYQFAVDEDALTGDGLYAQRLMLQAQQQGRGTILSTKSLSIGVNVLPSAVLGLSGQFTRVGGLATVDLGDLAQGPSAVPLQIRVSSTRAYRLQLSSRNSGQLILGETEWRVPYSVRLGETPLTLTSVATYDSTSAPTTTQAMPLQFVIGDVAGRRAGTYKDVLTISIAPK
jgi:hypothetical protein